MIQSHFPDECVIYEPNSSVTKLTIQSDRDRGVVA